MNNVSVYYKEYCPYCKAVISLLNAKGISFNKIEISNNDELRKEMVKRSKGLQTVPQIFIDNEHIGGASDLMLLEKENLLDPLLNLRKSA